LLEDDTKHTKKKKKKKKKKKEELSLLSPSLRTILVAELP